MSANPRSEPLRAALTMLVACVCFTAMSLAIGEAHAAEPALSTVASSGVRSVVNLVVIVLFARGRIGWLFGDARLALWTRGAAGAIALLTYFAAVPRVGIGEASFLNNTSAFWVAALAPTLLGEPARRSTWIAVVVSLVGLALLGLPRGGAPGDDLGRGLGALSGLAAAFAYLSVRRASASNPAEVIVFYFILTSTLASVGLGLVTEVTWPARASTWAWLVAAGIAATVGQLTMTRAYQMGEAAPLAALSTASPLMSAVAGVSLLGERPDGRAVVGMVVLAVAGVGLPLWSAARDRRRGG